MKGRPLLVSERLANEALAVLKRGQDADLKAMSRAELTLLRMELHSMKGLQSVCGQAAPWSVWRDAQDRVQAEIDLRPLPKGRKRRMADWRAVKTA
jgi:hypothetical protein